jgi:glycosyltransferase involved in cell wall biosynthesis
MVVMTEPDKESPTVSILIPVYNREGYIGECVRSAQEQTYADIEIIIVDNASTDATWKICQDLAEKDERIRVFQNEENIGPVRNWRRCVEEATGDYGKILWSDDLISPRFLEETVPLLSDPDVGFVFTQACFFKSGETGGEIRFQLGETGTYPSEEFIKGELRGMDFPRSPGCALFRMDDIRANLLLDVPNNIGSDFSMHAIGNDLLLFLLTANSYNKFGLVAETLSGFRNHADSISIDSQRRKLFMCYDMARAFFVESYRPDLAKILNVRLALYFLRFPNASKYEIKGISGYYMKPRSTSIAPVEFFRVLWIQMRRIVFKAISMTKRGQQQFSIITSER